MMNTPFRKILTSLGCAVTLSLSAMAPAQAAIIVGTFDPAFGGGFTNLGWKGSFTFEVPNGCLQQANGSYVAGINNCEDVNTLESQVTLYEFDNPAASEILNFGQRPSVEWLRITNQEVTGFIAGGCFECQNYRSPNGTLANVAAGYARFSYGLSFDYDLFASLDFPNATPTQATANLLAAIYEEDVTADVEKILFMDADAQADGFQKGDLYGNCSEKYGEGGLYYECGSTNAPDFTITTRLNEVPEPATGVLVLGALGAVAWVRRRKSRLN
jgi:hypothetical protein